MVSMQEIQKRFDVLFEELSKVIVGQDEAVEEVVIAIMTGSHALLEGYPGLAKTLMIKSIGQAMDLRFSRIQGTPDLLPSDVIGTYLIEESKGRKEFKFQPGPVFANVVLMDEINRASPKTQSALLEAMQEKQVTVGNATYKLEEPFFVLATQNPIEQEGTFKLPEAQSDRFLFKIKLIYPTYEQELEVVDKYGEGMDAARNIKKVFTKDFILKVQDYVKQVPIAKDMQKYVLDVVHASRTKKDLIEYGASPRASLGIIYAAKARALLHGRKFVSKEDIKAVAYPVLRHRIILNFEAERKGMDEDDVIKLLLK